MDGKIMSKISKSHRKLIALFSMSEGFALMMRGYYRDRPRNKTMLKLLRRLEDKVKAAATEWGFVARIDAKDYDRIQNMLRRYEARAIPKEGSPTLLLAVHLALYADSIQELIHCRAGDMKIVLMEEIEAATMALYRYWDRDFAHVEEADHAIHAVAVFNEELEAA